MSLNNKEKQTNMDMALSQALVLQKLLIIKKALEELLDFR